MTRSSFIIIVAILGVSFLGYKRISNESLKKEPLTASILKW